MSPRIISHPSHLPESHIYESQTTFWSVFWIFMFFPVFSFLAKPWSGGCLKRLGAGVETVQPTPFTDGPPTLMETSTFRCLYLGGAGGWVAVARDPHNVALRISSNCWDIVFIWNEDPTSEKSILHYCLSRRIDEKGPNKCVATRSLIIISLGNATFRILTY